MTEAFVLDSFALLALLGGEPGAEDVAGLLRQAQDREIRLLMTWVNIGEMAYIVERRWGRERLYAALATIEATRLEIAPVGRESPLAPATLMPVHLSRMLTPLLPDTESPILVTGDPEFKSLEELVEIHWLPQRQRSRNTDHPGGHPQPSV